MLWLGALAAVPAVGQSKGVADPADPASPVPPTHYAPMPGARIAAPTSSPADNWKALNRTVAAYDSMALTMEMPAPAGAAGAGAMVQPAPPADSRHMHKDVK